MFVHSELRAVATFLFGRGATPDTPFKWTYAQALGLEGIVANFIAMWDQVQTNKKVGFIFANDADGDFRG